MKETYPIPPQASAAEVGAASVTPADSRTVEVGASPTEAFWRGQEIPGM